MLPADGHNLVAPLTSLVGRDDDLLELARLIAGSRLVTVAGPGGLGKTRLAVEHGLRHAAEWEHGVWFVDLARITDPAAIPQIVAEATATPVAGGADAWIAVLEYLGDRRVLLVLDNCEHLFGALPLRVDALLRASPALHVLATSREPLALLAERVWRPSPLDAGTSGVELFMARAGLNDGEGDDRSRLAAIELCARLDGLPLAIELAAARTDVIGPAEILVRLDVQRGLIASRDPTLDPRQRSLEDLIDWSYGLLTSAEQETLRRLGMFSASFDLEAASAAAAGGNVNRFDVPELLWSLLSKSLLVADPGGGATRYRMLETVRAFVRQRLDGELADTAGIDQLAEFYLSAYGQQVDKLDATTVSDRSREIDNIRGLIHQVAAHDVDTAQLLACIVIDDGRRSSLRAAVDEGHHYLQQLPRTTPSRAALCAHVAQAAIDAGDPADASQLLDTADEIAATVGTPTWLDGRVASLRGIVAIIENDNATAQAISLAGLDRASTPRGRSYLLNVLAVASLEVGDYDAARDANERNLDELRALGAEDSCRIPLNNLAEIALRVGDRREAARCQLESLEIALTFGSMHVVAFSLIVAARLRRDDPMIATTFQTAADSLLADLGYSMLPSDRQLSDDLLDHAATRLGPPAFDQARRAGAELPIEQAVAQVRQALAVIAQPNQTPAQADVRPTGRPVGDPS